MAKILVIDDEIQIRKFLRISLGASGHHVIEADNATSGLAMAEDPSIELVVLDLGLPDRDGQEVISAIRDRGQDVPIIVLSVRAQEADKVEALDRGADDYMVKPFGIGELMARLRACLRSKPTGPTHVLRLGHLHLDFERRIVTKDEQEVRLSRREYDLLRFLAGSPDHVLTHREILKAVWGPAHVEDTAYLRVYVNQLRQKLEVVPNEPKLIVTEPGIGYRLITGT